MFYEVDMDEQLKFMRAEEREEGLAEGEARMADLVRRLLSQDRIDDLHHALNDPEFRNSLLNEMEEASNRK